MLTFTEIRMLANEGVVLPGEDDSRIARAARGVLAAERERLTAAAEDDLTYQAGARRCFSATACYIGELLVPIGAGERPTEPAPEKGGVNNILDAASRGGAGIIGQPGCEVI